MPVTHAEDRIMLKNHWGATADILLYGATVISWKSPDVDSSIPEERLFTSSKALLDGSKPVRGGIPIVFPCFGPPEHPDHQKLSQHGFARSEVWNFDSIVMDNEAGVSVRLTLTPRPSITAVYNKPFELAYVVTLSRHQLSTDLHVTNPSDNEPLEFQALLHNYIRGPAKNLSVHPLEGKRYTDKVDKAVKEETREAVDVRTFTDSVYEDTDDEIRVTWGSRGIVLNKTNFPTLTVWNPSSEAGRKLADMEDGGWERFVCVEPGYVKGFKKIAPKERWIGQQTMTVL
ncbi:unnamed protein product [Peniophora sp. CBMAI 1063]|nr:unnamed protein product [Peniophora sp. CBMAI 1063]